MTGLEKKVSLLRSLLDESKLDGLVLTLQKNVSWLTSGRSFVNQASEQAITPFIITRDTCVMIVNNIERDRMLEEEIDGDIEKVETYPWYEPEKRQQIIEKYTKQGKVETDISLEEVLFKLRTILVEEDIKQIQELGKEAAEAIERTTFELQQGETEYEIAGRLAANCLRHGIEPIVTLVAADHRTFTRRHPLPTNQKLEKYAMIVLCGRRRGQIISVSRLVHFGEPSQELYYRQQAVGHIDAQLIAHTKPGVTFAELFDVLKSAYKRVGYESEWNDHHQGGLSGYNTREMLLLPDSRYKVTSNQIYAWNPSIAGVKSEDTILVLENSQELLTHTGKFTYQEFDANGQKVLRPSILIRS
ncbi:M24 family metallopeptidase [Bacillus horti]|uniref:Xaa-Pro aminopeptidase n=1 Tax=Caldalkalibacillus horti TaxID=77523 RepID=A0ABT9VWS6_9BACI|nr:M24 family metallopeptidase [Bacillus horti]MDQ0165432.1 Xaa-Pro aminopeptidase [Bacillus horti]